MNWKISCFVSLIFFFSALWVREYANAQYDDENIGWYGNLIFGISMGLCATLIALSTHTQRTKLKEISQFHFPVVMGYSLFGLCILVANMFLFHAIYAAPNPGYARAVKSLNIVFLTFIGYTFFGKELTLEKIFGVVLILIGVYFVVIR
jgi:drug/metabolite transporter (DMT)-like permease